MGIDQVLALPGLMPTDVLGRRVISQEIFVLVTDVDPEISKN